MGVNSLYSNTTGSYNTANGSLSLQTHSIGEFNTANGYSALVSNTTGGYNMASGAQTLFSNTTSKFNTANGYSALKSNTTGSRNTANGAYAVVFNTIGENNTAAGTDALQSNTAGIDNTANGFQALRFNTTGFANTANGLNALLNNTIGVSNTANGVNALSLNTIGINNTASGVSALYSNTGNSNTAIGYAAALNLTTGTGNVCIGADVYGVAGESNTTRIRNIYSSVASGRQVYVDSDDKIGTLASSRRYKEQIKLMDEVSEAILWLKPVTFRYKKEVDPTQCLGFGLIAEEVAEVNADLVICDADGKPFTVRYEAVNAMLLNEFLKEHHQVHDLKAIVVSQQKQIDALTAGLQKVSAQLEASKPAPQVVENN